MITSYNKIRIQIKYKNAQGYDNLYIIYFLSFKDHSFVCDP